MGFNNNIPIKLALSNNIPKNWYGYIFNNEYNKLLSNNLKCYL